MSKWFLVTEWIVTVVEADTQTESIERAHDKEYAYHVKSSVGPRFREPVEAADWWEAIKKFREGPAAGMGL